MLSKTMCLVGFSNSGYFGDQRAETSLTVPGVRYVIDPGTARISHSVASKVQRLPIEAISQASANQRAGRSGRVADGVCFRLYDEQDFIRGRVYDARDPSNPPCSSPTTNAVFETWRSREVPFYRTP